MNMYESYLTKTYSKSPEQVLVGALEYPDASAITEGALPSF